MKDYKEVVSERFDKEKEISDSIYSPSHPIGKYLRSTLFKGLDAILEKHYRRKSELSEMKLLDVGCGVGGMLNYFNQKGFRNENMIGIDLSENRIEKAKLEYPQVAFKVADVLTMNLDEKKFDLITSFDLFSHLKSKVELLEGLKNVREHLDDTGIFLWYDIFSSDHFSPIDNADSWGFNKRQMIDLSKEAGFELISYKTFFKKFFGKYNSVYQAKRISPAILKFLEKILPGSPGNHLVILKKI